jgi:hypothetical protein
MSSLADITALGLLALVIILAYQFGGRMMSILNAHLKAVQNMDKRQTALLLKCAKELSAIKESFVDVANSLERDRMSPDKQPDP